jgi:hypothetical protein
MDLDTENDLNSLVAIVTVSLSDKQILPFNSLNSIFRIFLNLLIATQHKKVCCVSLSTEMPVQEAGNIHLIKCQESQV